MRGKRGEKTAHFVRRKLRHLFDIYFEFGFMSFG